MGPSARVAHPAATKARRRLRESPSAGRRSAYRSRRRAEAKLQLHRSGRSRWRPRQRGISAAGLATVTGAGKLGISKSVVDRMLPERV